MEKIHLKINSYIEIARQHESEARRFLKTRYDSGHYFVMESSADLPLKNDNDDAQALSFITKLDYVKMPEKILISEEDGKFHLGNLNDYRSAINEFRPIVENKRDSVHFRKIHNYCIDKLLNDDPESGLSISVFDDAHINITDIFLRMLEERVDAIEYLLSQASFDFLYNGVLQHSDKRHTKRYWKEYVSGEINYTFLVHAFYIAIIIDLLRLHYNVINQLTFPKLGSL